MISPALRGNIAPGSRRITTRPASTHSSAIEKYLKAYLHEHELSFGKTHDLVQLLDLIPRDLGLETLRPAMALLNSFAVKFRYPGESATRAHAREALALCKAGRDDMRRLLALD